MYIRNQFAKCVSKPTKLLFNNNSTSKHAGDIFNHHQRRLPTVTSAGTCFFRDGEFILLHCVPILHSYPRKLKTGVS